MTRYALLMTSVTLVVLFAAWVVRATVQVQERPAAAHFAIPPVATAPGPRARVAPAGQRLVANVRRRQLSYARAPGRAWAGRLARRTEFGTRRSLLVRVSRGAWTQVLLPDRPNGSTGWVRTADVSFSAVPYELRIDLSRRQLTLLKAGRRVLRAPVAIGAPSTPTPPGFTYVTDRIEPTKAHGPFGEFVFALAHHSAVLTEFGGGDGQVAIHGTNDRSSLGRNVSHGCIRVSNETMRRLRPLIQLGTPVRIVA